MKKTKYGTSDSMSRALKNLEQAKARYDAEKRKANEKRRKEQNHHKYLMGGIVAKYFPECYQYEEQELNVILAAAVASGDCREKIRQVTELAKRKEADPGDEKERDKESTSEEGTGGGHAGNNGEKDTATKGRSKNKSQEHGGYTNIQNKRHGGYADI